ncbi:hypothetical protein EDB81DRAFT_954082 [Dactylonectria macrodidyma]|uniref:Rhodopsin domain-containing protein n=1 Tax=Dactylonectria macrodidyma TaxID=307937 RepID=A0A9P9D0Y0_9HYPO|nr:hypothetical protein EDB81DRAFT_954082 [Dactylonectria macrodidyma]
MRDVPAEVRATWRDPDYDSPVRRGSTLIVVETCLVSLALLTLLARVYARLVVVKGLAVRVLTSRLRRRACVGADETTFSLQAFTVGVTVCAVLLDQLYGWNVHIWDLSIAEAVKGRQVSLAAQRLFLFSSGLPKVSILVTRERTQFRVAASGDPLLNRLGDDDYLHFFRRHLDAMRSDKGLLAIATLSLTSSVLSLPIVMKLHLPRHQRVMLALLFSGGLIVVLAGCQRAYWSYYVIEKTYDVTWEEFYLWIRTAVEANLGVICGNAPALRPLYGVVVARRSGRRIGSQSNNQVT